VARIHEDRGMALSVTTEHGTIATELARVVAADPIRHTLLGTIRGTLEDTAWLCWHPGGLAVRSSADYPVAISGEWPAGLRDELVGLLRDLPDLHEVSGPAEIVDGVARDLAPERELRSIAQRLFRLDELDPPTGVPGRAVAAAEDDRELVRGWYVAFMAEAEPERGQSEESIIRSADVMMSQATCWLWLDPDGKPVSMAARRPVVAGSARIGPVYTPQSARGHGYGSAVTAAATRDILDEGALPVLFTDLANPTSNKIYQRMGYRPVEDRVIVNLD
jgi:GNAT superfamily N-acetyltransferase